MPAVIDTDLGALTKVLPIRLGYLDFQCYLYRLSHESAIGGEFSVRFGESRAAASAVRHRGPE